MSFFFSPSAGAFFHRAIHGDGMPPDVVPITAARHAQLLEGQSAGQRIAADADGSPILLSPLPPGPPPVPAFVALWQFRREMRAREWWGKIEQAIGTLPAEARADVEEWLEYGTEVHRASPMLEALASAIGVPDEIDAAFIAAAARRL